jgi:hypothetical protein
MNIHNTQKWTSFSWGLIIGGIIGLEAPPISIGAGVVIMLCVIIKNVVDEAR